MFGIISYFLIAFVSALIVATILHIFSKNHDEEFMDKTFMPAFFGMLVGGFWPVGLPVFFGGILFIVLFKQIIKFIDNVQIRVNVTNHTPGKKT